MRTIGFGRGADDIQSNVAKIRNIYNKVSVEKRDSMPELLRYELEMGIVNEGKKKSFKTSSATMGLLWLGRSLNYQHNMFMHLLDNEQREPYEAACFAYENSMKQHMPWAMQKVCQTALKTLKGLRRDAILANIGGFSQDCYGNCEDEATRNDMRHVIRC